MAISPQDFDDLLRRASERPDMVSAGTACKMFDISGSTLDQLVREGRVTRYVVPGHPKTVRYRVTDLINIFKPL